MRKLTLIFKSTKMPESGRKLELAISNQCTVYGMMTAISRSC